MIRLMGNTYRLTGVGGIKRHEMSSLSTMPPPTCRNSRVSRPFCRGGGKNARMEGGFIKGALGGPMLIRGVSYGRG